MKLIKTNKKAMTDEMEWTIVRLFFLGLIVLMVWTAVGKVQDNSMHIINSKARDMALTYEAASQANGNLNLIYNSPKNLSIAISEECKISVEDEKKIPGIYFCNGRKIDTQFKKEENYYLLTHNQGEN